MHRYRSPLPPLLRVPQIGFPSSTYSPRPFPRLPPLDPSPREVYSERELLLEQKFALLHDINDLTSEVRLLQVRYDQVVLEHNNHQDFQIQLFRKMNDVGASDAQLNAHSRTLKQAALQSQLDELEEVSNSVAKVFSVESMNQIKTEVGVEKTVIQRIKAEIEALSEEKNRVESLLNCEELTKAQITFSDQKSEIQRLTNELSALVIKHQQMLRQQLPSDGRTEEDEEFSKLQEDMAALRARKFAKRQQLQKLGCTLEAKKQSVLNKQLELLLAEKSIYASGRFPVPLLHSQCCKR
jgi:hypothetical protein